MRSGAWCWGVQVAHMHVSFKQLHHTAGSTVNQLMPHTCIRVLGRVLPQEDPRMSSLLGMQSQEYREGPGRMGKMVTQAVPVSRRAQSRLVA